MDKEMIFHKLLIRLDKEIVEDNSDHRRLIQMAKAWGLRPADMASGKFLKICHAMERIGKLSPDNLNFLIDVFPENNNNDAFKDICDTRIHLLDNKQSSNVKHDGDPDTKPEGCTQAETVKRERGEGIFQPVHQINEAPPAIGVLESRSNVDENMEFKYARFNEAPPAIGVLESRSNVDENMEFKYARFNEAPPAIGVLESRSKVDENMELKYARDKLRDFVTKGILWKRNIPINIAVIGTPGVGKSSLVNTLIASMTGNYRTFCEVGASADFRSKTSLTQRTNMYEKGMFYNASLLNPPNFIDMSGFDNCNTKSNEELLKTIFEGRLPGCTPVRVLRKFMYEHGLEKFKSKYSLQESDMVNRIIFVASACDLNIPKDLIRCTRNAASPAIPIFGVLTMKDLVENDKESTQIRRLMQDFCKYLGISKDRFALIQNYTDADYVPFQYGQNTSNENLDIPALNFLRELCDPVHDVFCIPSPRGDCKDISYQTPLQSRDIRTGNFPQNRDVMKNVFKVTILALFVHFVVFPMFGFSR